MINPPAIYTLICAHSPQSAKLIELLNIKGHETRIIGGAIRNALLHQPITDIDMATTLLPDAVIKLAQKSGLKTIPTGLAHGTVTIILDKIPFEVTTLRQDIETNGRHAKVSFTRSFETDALRRDFTVNALSMDQAGKIYDYTNGLNDLEKQSIRFIGDPVQRIQEDYLRILRFFRFSATHGNGKLDTPALDACLSERQGIAALSLERIGHEMRKWLTAKYAFETIETISSTDLIDLILGVTVNYSAFQALKNAEKNIKSEPSFIRSLAALSLPHHNAAKKLQSSLKLSNRDYDALQAIHSNIQKYTINDETSELQFKQIIYKTGAPAFSDWLLLSASERPELIKMGIALAQNWPIPKNPFSGEYFIKRGLIAGPQLGNILKQAEKAWIEHGFTTNPDVLDRIGKDVIHKL